MQTTLGEYCQCGPGQRIGEDQVHVYFFSIQRLTVEVASGQKLLEKRKKTPKSKVGRCTMTRVHLCNHSCTKARLIAMLKFDIFATMLLLFFWVGKHVCVRSANSYQQFITTAGFCCCELQIMFHICRSL